jgi:hypothetical protein
MKKTGLLILVVVLALGAIGVGYAAWSQNLTVKGDVSTGTYGVKFDNEVASENDPLALATSTTGVAVSTADNPDDTLTITIDNGYPSYAGTATFDIVNTGSVPVKIKAITLTDITGVATISKTLFAVGDVIAVGDQIDDATVTVTINSDADQDVTGDPATVIVSIETEQGI